MRGGVGTPMTDPMGTRIRPGAPRRYIEAAMSSADQEAETDTTRALEAAGSFGEKLANKTIAGTEQAWATATHLAHQAIERLRKAVEANSCRRCRRSTGAPAGQPVGNG